MSESETIVIVGAGQAGGRCAEQLHDGGFKGQIVLIGDELYEPYERPALSKGFLMGAHELDKMLIRPIGWYTIEGIDLRLGKRVDKIDRAKRIVSIDKGKETLHYDRLVIATGSRPFVVKPSRGDDTAIHYVRTLDDAMVLRPYLADCGHIGIIGAGLLGLELASTASRLGCMVTVIDHAEYPMARIMPPKIASHMIDLHRRNGIDLLMEKPIYGLEADQDGAQIKLGDGQTVLVDTLIVAIGTAPNVELAKAAGLAVDDGILTDEFGRTSDPRIYAIGDVVNQHHPLLGRRVRLQNSISTHFQACLVANNLINPPAAFADVPWISTEQFGISIQMLGVPGPDARIVWRDHPAVGPAIGFAVEGNRLTGAYTFNAGRELKALKVLIEKRLPVVPEALENPGIRLSDMTGGLVEAPPERRLGAPSLDDIEDI